MRIEHPNILLDALENGVMIIDAETKIIYWNQWLEINTGHSFSDIVGKKLSQIYPKIDDKTLERKIKTTLTLKTPTFYDTSFSNRFITINRNKVSSSLLSTMQLQVTISPYLIEQKIVMISVYDISDLYELRLSLQYQMEKSANLTMELQHDKKIIDDNLLIVKTDGELNITHLSHAFCSFFGYHEKELLSWPLHIFYSDQMPPSEYTRMKDKFQKREQWHGELKILAKNKTIYWMEAVATPFIDQQGELISYTTIYHDISDKKRIEYLAVTDRLTGLYNRHKFHEVLDAMLLRGHWRDDDTFALVIFDVDHFKKVNDTYGHQAGDSVLISIAKVMEKTVRHGDFIARWGGEEFVVLLPNVDQEKTLIAVEKIRTNIEETKISDVGNVTASFGVSLYCSGDNAEAMIQRADRALYLAKESGRNCIKFN